MAKKITKIKRIKTKIIKFLKPHIFFLFIIFGFSLIFIINLSGQDYSGDEHATVFLARSILIYGVPSAWDGNSLLSLGNGLDFVKVNNLYLWSWHPWLQFYLAAAGIFFGGETLTATRFPFAMFGIFTVILLYFISQELFKNRFISLMLSLQLVFHLPFFLYVRNVRYYSPGVFFSLLTIFLLMRYTRKKWGIASTIILFLTSFLLFHTNYLIWGTTIVMMLVIFFQRRDYRMLILCIGEILFAIFWFILFKPYGSNIGITSRVGWEFLINLFHYLSYINAFVFPFILFPFFFFIRKYLSKWFVFLLFIISVKIFFYTVFLYAHGRYLVEFFPILILFYGFIYLFLIKKGYWLICLLIFIVTINSNILNFLLDWPIHPEKTKVHLWLAYYKIELTEKYTSVMPQIGAYLDKNYRKGDLYFSTLPLYVYTKVPSLSPVIDTETKKYRGPSVVSNPKKLRWIIVTNNTKEAELEIYNIKEYRKFEFNFSENTWVVNDGDIYNRIFPPGKIEKGSFLIYERK